jgi:hypothetical protein
MHINNVTDIRPDVTAFDTARTLWVGANHRDLVDNLRRTAQRRTRVRTWVRRSTSWI